MEQMKLLEIHHHGASMAYERFLYFLPLWLLFMNENGGFYFTITPSRFDVITLSIAMVCLL